MELKDYTFEEIKAEYKRRMEERKVQREQDMKKDKRCRNCIHFNHHPYIHSHTICTKRTWGKRNNHYVVKHYTPACTEFQSKYNEE